MELSLFPVVGGWVDDEEGCGAGGRSYLLRQLVLHRDVHRQGPEVVHGLGVCGGGGGAVHLELKVKVKGARLKAEINNSETTQQIRN